LEQNGLLFEGELSKEKEGKICKGQDTYILWNFLKDIVHLLGRDKWKRDGCGTILDC